MKIVINEVEIDYSLEQESTVGEVFAELDEWLRRNGHVIETIHIDSAAYKTDDPEWRAWTVDSVNEMNLVARSIREQDLNDLETINQYFALLQRVVNEGTPEQQNDALEVLESVLFGVRRLLPEVAEAIGDGAVFRDPARKGKAYELCAMTLSVVQTRRREIAEPERESQATVTALRQTLNRIEGVPAQLQSGDSGLAMTTLTRFTELVSKLLRMLPMLMEVDPSIARSTVEEKTMPDFVLDLNTVLTELVEAFSSDDFVLVGDLLEYEVSPRVVALLDALER